jgi:hypothetical protein
MSSNIELKYNKANTNEYYDDVQPDSHIYHTVESGKIKTIHTVQFSELLTDWYKFAGVIGGAVAPCSPTLTCLFCKAEELTQRTYIHVMENRLEYNYPSLCCCNQVDDVKVIYYDRNVMDNVDVAGSCTPFCTHCSLCPTCCDSFGGAVVLSSDTCNNKNPVKGVHCCFGLRQWTMLPCLENPEVLRNAIMIAKTNARIGNRVTVQELTMSR